MAIDAPKTRWMANWNLSETRFFSNYFSIAVFLLGALALWIPSGYSIGAVALLVGSFVVLTRAGLPELSRLQWVAVSAMVLYSLVWMVDGAVRGDGLRDLDQASRVLIAVPVLLAVAQLNIRWSFAWLGAAVGGMGAFVLAVIQVSGGAARASGYIGPEPFGNVSALLAGLSLIGVLWFSFGPQRSMLNSLLCAMGASGAAFALVFTGTRASWLSFAAILCVLLFVTLRNLPPSVRLKGALLAVFGLVIVAVVASTLVKDRVLTAAHDISSYVNGDSRPGSIGARFEAWKGTVELFSEKPLLGWGENPYKSEMERLADAGVIHQKAARFNHGHNQFLDAVAKKGIAGGLALLLVYLLPAIMFTRGVLQSDLPNVRLIAGGGLVVVANAVGYGTAHTVLENNAGVMTFAFYTATLLGGYAAAAPPSKPVQRPAKGEMQLNGS